MTERQAIEDLLEELYAARVRGDLDAVVNLFAANATFQVAGTDEASAMPTLVKGNAGIRDLMRGMLANFEVSDFTVLEMLIDGPSAAVRWQATFMETSWSRSRRVDRKAPPASNSPSRGDTGPVTTNEAPYADWSRATDGADGSGFTD